MSSEGEFIWLVLFLSTDHMVLKDLKYKDKKVKHKTWALKHH